MFSQYMKAGAALFLMAGGIPALAQNQSQETGASASVQTEIVTVKTTPQQVAFTQIQSGKQMSPKPEIGNLAMLITGVCLVGVAARRRTVAA